MLGNISKETDPGLLGERQKRIDNVKQTQEYNLYRDHAEDHIRQKCPTPDIEQRFQKEIHFKNQCFEWQTHVSDWASHFERMREVATPHGTPPADPVETEVFGEDDPFNPNNVFTENNIPEDLPEPAMDDFHEDERDFEPNSVSPQKPKEPQSTLITTPKERLCFD